MNSKNVNLEDVVLRNGHGWQVPILHASHVNLKNVRVISPLTSNTDGINPDASTDVVLDNVVICSGDDAVTVKATNFGTWLRKKVNNIRVQNSILLTMKSALKIGTETRAEKFSDIVFRNNDILISDRAFTIYIRDGTTVENVKFIDNRVEKAGGLREDHDRIIDIAIDRRDEAIWQHPRWKEVRDNPGKLRHVVFRDIQVNTENSLFLNEDGACRIKGFNESNNIEDIQFSNFFVNRRIITNPSTQITVGKKNHKVPFAKIDGEFTKNITFLE
jgi:polygalacturonase